MFSTFEYYRLLLGVFDKAFWYILAVVFVSNFEFSIFGRALWFRRFIRSWYRVGLNHAGVQWWILPRIIYQSQMSQHILSAPLHWIPIWTLLYCPSRVCASALVIEKIGSCACLMHTVLEYFPRRVLLTLNTICLIVWESCQFRRTKSKQVWAMTNRFSLHPANTNHSSSFRYIWNGYCSLSNRRSASTCWWIKD